MIEENISALQAMILASSTRPLTLTFSVSSMISSIWWLTMCLCSRRPNSWDISIPDNSYRGTRFSALDMRGDTMTTFWFVIVEHLYFAGWCQSTCHNWVDQKSEHWFGRSDRYSTLSTLICFIKSFIQLTLQAQSLLLRSVQLGEEMQAHITV